VSDQAIAVLSSSRDPNELVTAALTLARSRQRQDHQSLGNWLVAPNFLLLLDSAQEYAQTGRRLRIQRVLQALADNPAQSAKELLVSLTQSRGFLEHRTRVEYLLRACASVRPAPPEVIRFWDRYSQPDDGFSNVTMDAVISNGSAPAMQLAERKLAEEAQPEEDREHWIHCYILSHRNDPGVLQGCLQMLSGTLPARFRPMLVDALFDYRPTEWFTPAETCKPPDRAQASPEARQLLRAIAAQAHMVNLTPAQQQAITRTLHEIGQ